MAQQSSDFNPYHVWLGASPEHESPNLYQLLNIPEFVSSEQVIENGYNRQMGFLQAIKGGEHVDIAERLKGELARARLQLRDPAKKADYDRRLRDEIRQREQVAERVREDLFRERLEESLAAERARFEAKRQSRDAERQGLKQSRQQIEEQLAARRSAPSAADAVGKAVPQLVPRNQRRILVGLALFGLLVGGLYFALRPSSQKAPPTGRLKLEFTQATDGWTFQLDEQPIAARDWTQALPLPVGDHFVVVTGPGIEPFAESFSIRPEEETKLTVRCVEHPAEKEPLFETTREPGTGTLRVRYAQTPPNGVVIKLDGKPRRLVDLQNGVPLSVGDHHLLSTGPKLEPFLAAIAIRANAVTDLVVPFNSRLGSPTPSPTPPNSVTGAVPFNPRPDSPTSKPSPIPPNSVAGTQPSLAIAPFTEDQAKKHQQAWAIYLGQPLEKELKLPGGATLTMILIPPGEFVREESGKQFPVRLTKPFYLGKYEVTQAQWQSVMGNNPSEFSESPRHPVEQVSWFAVQPFLSKLNEAVSADKWAFVLPTEAQWEYACRAGTTTAYSFGDSDAALPHYGWFDRNAGRKTHPVGQLRPNPFGLYDMQGNVLEWCADWFQPGYYSNAPLDDPPGPFQGSDHVNRGGSWYLSAKDCRASIRNWNEPAYRFKELGFRLAQVPSTEPVTLAHAKITSTTPSGVPATPPAKPAVAQPRLAVAPFSEDQAKKHQQVWSTYLGQPVEKELKLPGGATMTMILIPPGEFVREEGGKQFSVRLTKPFYLGKYEVTQTQWQSVMRNNPSHSTRSPAHPVEQVSWNDIQPFMTKLNAASLGDKMTFMLPTEAQWEFACRAGKTTVYSFGDSEADLPRHGWFIDNAGGKAHPVGQLKPNSFGLCDMHGSVWEWCTDWHEHGYYAKAPFVDPPGPSSGSDRVVRGGGWRDSPRFCRASSRSGFVPALQDGSLGFRVAQVPSMEPTTIAPAKITPANSSSVPATLPANPAVVQPPLAVAPFNEDQAQKHQQAWANYLGQSVEKEIKLPGGATLTMILIPPGEFVREESGKQFPVRHTQPFYLGKYEATQAQWQSVMGNNPSHFKGTAHPVEQVSWNDIRPFIAKLNAASLGDKMTFALPTEAQWEYASRGGTTTAYSFGDSEADLPQYGWFIDNGGGKTRPVGQLKPNSFGLYDMHGNVWEWCTDWYEGGYYAKAPFVNPPGPSLGSDRVYRGGSWIGLPQGCRSASRSSNAPGYRDINLGFRVALVQPSK